MSPLNAPDNLGDVRLVNAELRPEGTLRFSVGVRAPDGDDIGGSQFRSPRTFPAGECAVPDRVLGVVAGRPVVEVFQAIVRWISVAVTRKPAVITHEGEQHEPVHQPVSTRALLAQSRFQMPARLRNFESQKLPAPLHTAVIVSATNRTRNAPNSADVGHLIPTLVAGNCAPSFAIGYRDLRHGSLQLSGLCSEPGRRVQRHPARSLYQVMP
jgi:hypothetical protein